MFSSFISWYKAVTRARDHAFHPAQPAVSTGRCTAFGKY